MLIQYLLTFIIFTIVWTQTLYAQTDMQPTVFKDSKEQVPAGTTYDYFVRLSNNTGLLTTSETTLTIDIPKGFYYLQENSNYGCVQNNAQPSDGSGKVTCTFGASFPGNSYKDINITVRAGEIDGVFNSDAKVSYTGDTNNANDQESVKTTVIPSADMEIVSLEASPSPVVSGGIINYKTTVTNHGPYDTSQVEVTYNLPEGLEFVDDNASSSTDDDANWSCAQEGTGTSAKIKCKLLPVDTEFAENLYSTFNFRLKATEEHGTITVLADVDTKDNIDDINTSNNSKEINITIEPGTDLAMKKSVDYPVFIEGEIATFTLNARNDGYTDAPNVVVTDIFPAGHDFNESNITAPNWNCSVTGDVTSGKTLTCYYDGNLSKQSDSNITIQSTTPKPVVSDTDYSNTADINSTTLADANPSNNSHSVDYLVRTDGLDLEVEKNKGPKNNSVPGNPIAVGDIALSKIEVKNNGPRNALANTIIIKDVLDDDPAERYDGNFSGDNWDCNYSKNIGETGGVVTCIYTKELNSSQTTSTLEIESVATQDGTMVNQVDVNHTGEGLDPGVGDTNINNNQYDANISVTPEIEKADLVVIKDSNDSHITVDEDSFIYSIKIRNDGPSKATDVRFSDTIPQYFEGYGTLAATTIVADHNSTHGGSCSVSGADVECTIDTIEASETVKIDITVSGAMTEGLQTNTASAFSRDVGDPDRTNNKGTTDVNVDPKADVQVVQNEISKTEVDEHGNILAGTDATYYIQIRNNGPSTAQNVELNNTFDTNIYQLLSMPSGCSSPDGNKTIVCNMGNLDYQEVKDITFKLRPKHYNTPPSPWELNNRATVATTTFDINRSNNELNATLPITYGEVDLSIEKSEAENFFEPVPFDHENSANNIIVYKITITNFGPSVATDVNYIDKVIGIFPDDHNMTFLGDTANADGSDYNTTRHCTLPTPQPFIPGSSAPEINCTVPYGMDPNIEATKKYKRYLVFHVDEFPNQLQGDVYHNDVNVSANETEREMGNNSEDERTTVRTKIDLSITKTASVSSPIEVGEDFNFTFRVENAGPGYAKNTIMEDKMPDGMKIRTISVVEGNSTAGNGSCQIKEDNTLLECNFNDNDGVMKGNEYRKVEISAYFESYPSGGTSGSQSVVNDTWVRSNGGINWQRLETNTTNNDDNATVSVYQPIHIGDFVWHDEDADGIQDNGEDPIEGVTVKLYNSSNELVATTETNSTGEYGFDLNSSGNYYIVFDASNISGTPDGDLGFDRASPQYKGGDSQKDSNINDSNQTDTFFVAYGDNNLSLDAGFFDYVELGDEIWVDTNGNGKQDSGESLYTTSDTTYKLYKEGNSTAQATIINSTGSYKFTDLVPGNYYVTFSQPTNYEFTLQNYSGIAEADNSDVDSTGKSDTVTLVSGDDDVDLDAGVYKSSTSGGTGVKLGDRVWYDSDYDGIQDSSESGVEGVLVILTNTYTGDTNTTYTDVNGKYLFENLIPGPYTVKFDINDTYGFTLKDNVSDDTNDSDVNIDTNTTDVINLVSGEDNLTIDAGIYKPVTVGDRVWIDSDFDGIQDSGENGLQGVWVQLYNANTDTVVDTDIYGNDIKIGTYLGYTETDSNGYYSFPNLRAGIRYKVKIALNSFNSSNNKNYYITYYNQGTDDTNDSDANRATYFSDPTPEMKPDDKNLTLDAGVYEPIKVGDYVWEDLNADGIQNDGATGIADVTVKLFKKDGTPVATTKTDSNGEYLFEVNATGEFYIVFDENTSSHGAYDGVSPRESGGDRGVDSNIYDTNRTTEVFTLTYGNDDLSLDAGFYDYASLGDFVWLDSDGNGRQDESNAGEANVTVELYYEGNTSSPLKTTKTDENGSYLFDKLIPDNYYVKFIAPSGYHFTYENPSASYDTNSDANKNGVTDPITLTSGEANRSIDAGIFEPVSIGDRTWIDSNYDGIQNNNEANLSGVKVTLRYQFSGTPVTKDLNGQEFGSGGVITTDANGSYLFDNIKPSKYILTFEAPNGYFITKHNVGGTDEDNDSDINGTDTSIGSTQHNDWILTSGEDNESVDAGFYEPVSVGDRVWIDANFNGVQDSGENNLSGVEVTLYTSDGSRAKDILGYEVAVATTNANGYLFTNLPPTKQYYVKFDIASYNTANSTEYYFTHYNNDSNDSIDSDASASTQNSDTTSIMYSGDTNLTLDAGVYEPIKIGDRVWEDANADGIQDSGENNISGVTVKLFKSDGSLVATTTTDSNGEYLFELNATGDYYIEFNETTSPNGVYDGVSPRESGGDRGVDSNIYDSNRTTEVFTLTYGNDDLSLDAGFYNFASVGNNIFLDYDSDGLKDTNDVNFTDGNVTVQLFKEGSTTVFKELNTSDGTYQFTDLIPGNYYIKFIPPSDYYIVPSRDTDSRWQTDRDDRNDANTTGETNVFTLSSDENNTVIDAGIYKPASIGDRTWHDVNGDGLQDSDEANLSGVKVTLYYANGTTRAKDIEGNALPIITTDSNGSYLFENLHPSYDSDHNYVVKFEAPSGYAITQYNQGVDVNNSDANSSDGVNGTTVQYTLKSGDALRDVDAGFYKPVTIGDRVWIDANYNGIQDLGEEGLGGVYVGLFDADTNQPVEKDAYGNNIGFSFPFGYGKIQTRSVSPNIGEYFFKDLPAGKRYYVQFFLDIFNGSYTNYKPTLYNQGDDAKDSDITYYGVNDYRSDPTPYMRSDEDNLTLDAGVYEPASYGDRIWHDLNANGVQDSNEPDFTEQVTVSLRDENNNSVTDINGNPVADIDTSNGSYTFSNLVPGTYHAKFTFPSGYVVTKQDSTLNGGNDNNDSDVNPDTNTTINTTLTTGEDNVSWDVGVYKLVSLGDVVWYDDNANGIQDSGESNVSDVNVSLYEVGNPVALTSQLTDTNGKYLFENLTPSSYYVVFDSTTLPTDYIFTEQNVTGSTYANNSDANVTTGQTHALILTSGEDNRSLDAGIYKPVKLGDRVWIDSNANGIQDGGEVNATQSIKVTLVDNNGREANRTKDVINGAYLFDDVRPGDYKLYFELPNGYVITTQGGITGAMDLDDSDVNATTQFSDDFTLTSNKDDLSRDMGLYQNASLGDYVWIDANGDGIQDISENGVADINVTLRRSSDDSYVDSMDTNNTGGYLFEGLTPDAYYIVVEINSSYVFTKQNVGSDEEADSDVDASGRSDSIVLSTNEDNRSLDAGIFKPIKIGDRIWIDTNADGVQDSGEHNYSGSPITVTLYETNTNNPIEVITTGDGNYSFENVAPGEYYIEFSNIPTSYYISPKNSALTNDANDSDVNGTGYTPSFTVVNGVDDLSFDMGLYQKAKLGDVVWYDANGNGIQDVGESNVTDHNITVNLYKMGTAGIFKTQNTVDGKYLFENLTPGDYYVEFNRTTLPTDYIFTEQNATGSTATNNSDANVTTGQTHTIILTSNEDNRSLDAGIYKPVSIGDYAWVDVDGNGEQNTTEPFLAGVKVSLWHNVNGVDTQVTTDLDGNALMSETNLTGGYRFSNLRPDTYFVQFEAPANSDYILTQNNKSGVDDAKDSDTNVTATKIGKSGDYTLASGEYEPSVDAGFYIPASLGDYIWIDANGDGLQQTTEPKVQDANVTLFDANGTQVTHDVFGNKLGNSAVDGVYTTGVDGNYSFTNLRPSSYYIQVVTPDNTQYVFTTQNVDSDNNNSFDSDVDASGRSDSIVLSTNEDNRSLDAGIFKPIKIGDRIWIDSNANGVQDSGEHNYSGSPITVTLYETNTNNPIEVITTGDGNYSFENVAPGEYYIEFSDIPNGYYISPKDSTSTNDANDSDVNATNPTTGKTDSFVVKSNEDNLTLDMGLYQRASLGDVVWYDNNGDGIQNNGELNVTDHNITVILYNGSGAEQNRTYTGNSGKYLFENLTPSSYYVVFDSTTLPTDYIFTEQNATGSTDVDDSDVNASTGKTRTIVLHTGENNVNLDAGIYKPASIGNYTWLDMDGDGAQDNNESALPNVTVTLWQNGTQVTQDIDGKPFGTKVTDANGSYLFDNLRPGDYSVRFEAPAGYVLTLNNAANESIDSDTNVTAQSIGQSRAYTLSSGEDNRSVDAGFYASTTQIGDRVWVDMNQNGIQDNNESDYLGLVTVSLYDNNGTKVSEVNTSNGSYNFNGVKPSEYYIVFTVPNGYGVSPTDQTNDNNDSDVNASGQTKSFVILSNQQDMSNDMGIYPLASLGDTIWLDSNNDGIQDANESGVVNIKVSLYDSSNNYIRSVNTDSNGSYLFTNLEPGDYYIHVDHNNTYSFTQPSQGTKSSDSDIDPTTGKSDLITLGVGENNTSLDGGLSTASTIGDRIWVDSNRDGIQGSGESNYNGSITVSLYDANSSNIIKTTTTTNGVYSFTNVPSGDYFVEFSLPSNYYISPSYEGNNSGNDSDVDPSTKKSGTIYLGSGESNLTIDMGIYYVPPIVKASIGDRIWIDDNANGTQDANESDYNGSITVTLYSSSGSVVATQITTDGSYKFNNLTPASYFVEFTLPNGYRVTTQGSGNSSDSDVNATTLRTPLTTLSSGENDMNWDMGIVPVANSIGDRVWHDLNANGIQDAGEPKFDELITVTLYDSNGTKVAEINTTDGTYLFENIQKGEYYVVFTLPKDYEVSPQGEGNHTTLDSSIDPITHKSSLITIDGNSDLSIDVGVYKKVSLGDKIWIDSNRNGIQDANESSFNEPVTVTLYDKDGQIVATQDTSDGSYRFEDLIPNDYYVTFTLPQGYSVSAMNQGSNGELDSDINTSTFSSSILTLHSGENNTSIDMGIYPGTTSTASIGDRVWVDSNQDGIQDANEENLNVEINVTLYDANGSKIQTITTRDGNYYFDNLSEGNYSIGVTLPNDYILSVQSSGSDSAKDSDINTTTMRSGIITIEEGGSDVSIDIGLYSDTPISTPTPLPTVTPTPVPRPTSPPTFVTPPAGYLAIGNLVWFDANQNGLQDSDEKGVKGIIVTLFDGAGNRLKTTYTNYSGYYVFYHLKPGTYTIEFTGIPSGYTFTTPEVGTSEVIDSNSDTSGRVNEISLTSSDFNIDVGIHLATPNDESTAKPTIPQLPDGGLCSEYVYAVDDYVIGNYNEIAHIDVLENDKISEYYERTRLHLIDEDDQAVDILEVNNEGTWLVEDDKILFMPIDGFRAKATPVEYEIYDCNRSRAWIYIAIDELITKDDNATTSPGKSVSLDVLANDKGSIDIIQTKLGITENFPIANTVVSQDQRSVSVPGEGVWEIDEFATVTFTPDKACRKSPTPIRYSASTSDSRYHSSANIYVTIEEN